MNLSNLFVIQDKLDERILQEHNLQGQDLLDKKILALQVELGECANEWREFKFWSQDREPRNFWTPRLPGVESPLLEEYVDCLHFILSIGNDIDLLGYLEAHNLSIHSYDTMASSAESIDFNNLFISIANFADSTDGQDLRILFIEFIKLGEMLGFTWEQIEQAYLDKNKVNHERQNNGY